MSVLIKGMEMPKCCVECEWHEYYGGDYDWVHACRRTGTMPIGNADTERANDCPLVEIPVPHGDLIDRDALRIAELDTLIMIRYKLAYAPTVIELEEGSENYEQIQADD